MYDFLVDTTLQTLHVDSQMTLNIFYKHLKNSNIA